MTPKAQTSPNTKMAQNKDNPKMRRGSHVKTTPNNEEDPKKEDYLKNEDVLKQL